MRERDHGRPLSVALAITMGALSFSKAWLLISSWDALVRPDAVLEWLSARGVISLATVFEAIVALVLLLPACQRYRGHAALWLATVFTVYRAGASLAGYPGSCHCLGAVPNVVKLSASAVAMWTDVVYWALVLGAAGLLLTDWIQGGGGLGHGTQHSPEDDHGTASRACRLEDRFK